MVWRYINFPTLIKKVTFTYCDSNPGDSRSQKMWRCCSQIASDYIKSYINPLRLVSAPPPPPPPRTSSAPCFSGSGSYRHPCYSYTWYTGVSQKQLPLTKVLGIQLLKNLSNLLFLCRTAPVHFRNTLCQKMHSLLHQSSTRESFSRSFFHYSFSPFLDKCQLFMPKDFWNLPVNPVWRVPGFMKRGGRQITSVATPFYCHLSPNSQTSEFLIYSFYTFKNFC